jgi:predicted  nucleic acid-binding Zn-ribbon protein
VKDELRRLPEELERRQGQLDKEREQLKELQRAHHELRTRVKEIEDMTTMQRQRMRKLESEAAGSRADTALIVAYQHQIRTLKRDIGTAEEEGLELVEQADELKKRVAEQTAQVARGEQELALFAANVDSETRAAEERRASLEQMRQSRMGPMSAEVLAEYEKLLDAREGRAIAAIEGRICQGCCVTVPNNIYVRLARGVELVTCPSCGRILYLPDL